ncbi:hypothetical protein [Halalkalibacterium halodurans]|uniref:hypothetical protein n=1 Tax=Halalkalibacterium halodurans TaxID=86665 RepID=UPI002AA96D7C|nr:hypothetical protein [Halalkalibacterium halodurans]MDY7221847.1 hypothetical protein [Halalkalibacterium halodurans]MDY7241123.1 hypothetical protein [Halalkalibacterium halodurans]
MNNKAKLMISGVIFLSLFVCAVFAHQVNERMIHERGYDLDTVDIQQLEENTPFKAPIRSRKYFRDTNELRRSLIEE